MHHYTFLSLTKLNFLSDSSLRQDLATLLGGLSDAMRRPRRKERRKERKNASWMDHRIMIIILAVVAFREGKKRSRQSRAQRQVFTARSLLSLPPRQGCLEIPIAGWLGKRNGQAGRQLGWLLLLLLLNSFRRRQIATLYYVLVDHRARRIRTPYFILSRT